MITPSVITYTVSDSDLNFKVTVNSEYEANLIQNNINDSKELIKALSKYHKLVDRKISNENYKENTKQSWLLDKDGTFNGISEYSSTTRIDNWDGRPPIHDSDTTETELVAFMPEIKAIIDKIKEIISELEYITPHKAMFAYLPQEVLDVVERNLKIAEDDLSTIRNYSSIKNTLEMERIEKEAQEIEKAETIKTL